MSPSTPHFWRGQLHGSLAQQTCLLATAEVVQCRLQLRFLEYPSKSWISAWAWSGLAQLCRNLWLSPSSRNGGASPNFSRCHASPKLIAYFRRSLMGSGGSIRVILTSCNCGNFRAICERRRQLWIGLARKRRAFQDLFPPSWPRRIWRDC